MELLIHVRMSVRAAASLAQCSSVGDWGLTSHSSTVITSIYLIKTQDREDAGPATERHSKLRGQLGTAHAVAQEYGWCLLGSTLLQGLLLLHPHSLGDVVCLSALHLKAMFTDLQWDDQTPTHNYFLITDALSGGSSHFVHTDTEWKKVQNSQFIYLRILQNCGLWFECLTFYLWIQPVLIDFK